MTLQTTMMQLKNQLKKEKEEAAAQLESQVAALTTQVKDLEAVAEETTVKQDELQTTNQEQQEKAAEELLAAQQSGKVVSNERDMLAKEVVALKTNVGAEEAGESYAESIKEAYEAQIQEMNEEVMTLQ